MHMPENRDWLDKSLARRAFERAAETYDAAAALQNEVGRRLVERLDFIRMQPRKILDLGAGTGVFTRVLGKRYRKADVTALDIAPAMLQQVRTRGGWWRRPECVCGDAEALPFADASFDFIYSNLMLQWCMDLPATLVELRRVLAPGGLLMFTTLGPDTLSELRASWSAVDGYTHVNPFIDMHDVGDALLQARWAEPVMDAERLTMTYRDLDTLMLDLKNIGAHNVTRGRARGLTGKRRFQAFNAAYEALRRDGVLPSTYEVIYGHAWSPVEKSAAVEVQPPLVRRHVPGGGHGND
jgi:malonyl-CoA O-methyltransferase